MKTVENLINANNNKKLGNHRKEFVASGQKYYYYATCICEVNHDTQKVILDKSWGSQSTTRAVNAYMRELKQRFTTRNYTFEIIE